MFSHIKAQEKYKLEKLLISSLWNPWKNVNNAVKTIVGESVAPSQNDEIDTDMHFCESLVSSVKALSPEKNSLAQVKTQKVLFEIEFGENLD